jgi:hypothetical protein
MYPTIVLLSGWSRSGKDTVASLMIDEMGFYRVAFADALKQMCAKRFDMEMSDFGLRKDKPLDAQCPLYPSARTPRDILLAYARDLRIIDDKIFANTLAVHMKRLYEDGVRRFVISDWRWPMEADVLYHMFPRAHFIRVRIERPGITQPADSSEHSLDTADMDVCIQNDGSLSDLRDNVKHGLRTLL